MDHIFSYLSGLHPTSPPKKVRTLFFSIPVLPQLKSHWIFLKKKNWMFFTFLWSFIGPFLLFLSSIQIYYNRSHRRFVSCRSRTSSLVIPYIILSWCEKSTLVTRTSLWLIRVFTNSVFLPLHFISYRLRGVKPVFL